MSATHETISPALDAGHVLQEYTIESVLGVGGFGITYLATDSYLHKTVAIKEYFPAGLAARNQRTSAVAITSSSALEEFNWGKTRYMQEAQTLARFNHPNIVRVYRYFEENNTSYMVMAFEEGSRFQDVLVADVHAWTEQRVLDFIMPLLSGLTEVHKTGFLHRDIKPENIVIRKVDQSPVLLDFGSSRSMMTSHTMTAMVSPGFGPPEQYSSDPKDQGPWTDIYALAALLYRIVTGRVPVPSVDRVIKDTMLPAVFAGNGKYSKPFLAAIDKGLSVDSARRPQNVAAWSELLTVGANQQLVPPQHRAEPETPLPPSRDVAVAPAQILRPVIVPITSPSAGVAPMPVVDQPNPTSRLKPMPAHPSRTGRRVGLAFVALVLVVFIGCAAWLSTDKGFLRVSHFLYTTGLESKNSDLVYAFVCPNYFQSGMSIKDLSPSWYDSESRPPIEHFQSLEVDSGRATILSSSAAPSGDGTATKQTWVKGGIHWCRDALTDFRESNRNRAQTPTTKSQPARKAPSSK